MSEIKTFSFSAEGIEEVKSYKFGKNWPVVYLLENGSEMYIGETIRAHGRFREHIENPDRKKLKSAHVISDEEFNKSAALDIESSLIEYMVADQRYKIQNGNKGLQNHDYYDRALYQSKFEALWEDLRKMGLVNKEWRDIKNSDLFKYSPYKTLTDDQYLITKKIFNAITQGSDATFVVNGGPGTGKTIVATYLIKRLVDDGVTNVALVIAMSPLRSTLKKVFRSIPGLSSKMVIGPAEAVSGGFNILLVDEAHRLRRRKNIPNFGSFDAVNRELGFGNEADELDWIQRSAQKVVLFYDKNQSVRPSDILPEKITQLDATHFTLESQLRVAGGQQYLTFIDQVMDGDDDVSGFASDEYDFKIFDNFTRFIAAIKQQEKNHSLARLVAGYGWEWKSKKNTAEPDICIDGQKLFWNSKLKDWVNSEKAPDEVGCIHTIQGYDLNYAGVIIGPELVYDVEKQELVVIKEKYKDANGHRGVSDPDELRRYVLNIYKTLLTRGILGTYVYIIDDNLRNYFKAMLRGEEVSKQNLLSPYQRYVDVQLFDSVGCGEAMFADSVSSESVSVPAELIRKGAKYFALRTRGDSMDKLGVHDGDIILCQKNYQAPSGSNAIVMIGEDAAFKKIEYQRDGLLIKPQSTNDTHQDRLLGEFDEFKVIGTFVAKID